MITYRSCERWAFAFNTSPYWSSGGFCYKSHYHFLADFSTQYDRRLVRLCCLSVCTSVRPSVRLWRCALWLNYNLTAKESEQVSRKCSPINTILHLPNPLKLPPQNFHVCNSHAEDPDHGYSRQRSIAIPYIVEQIFEQANSTIGYLSNSWAFCLVVWCIVVTHCFVLLRFYSKHWNNWQA